MGYLFPCSAEIVGTVLLTLGYSTSIMGPLAFPKLRNDFQTFWDDIQIKDLW